MRNSKKSKLLLLFVLCLTNIIAAQVTRDNIYKFDLGNGKAAQGFQKVGSNDTYSNNKGFGFISTEQLFSSITNNSNPLTNDFISSNNPFYFVVDLPEGNYEVIIGFGDPNGTSLTTVKAESRRLMLENIHTDSSEVLTDTIWVNVRTPKINETESIKLKSREINYLNWDNKLTLEFNNKKPCVSFIEINKLDNARTIFLAGNSTVVDQEKEPWASWGQMITNFLKPEIVVSNFAESGEALLSFRNEYRLKKILSLMKKDDYLFIEFAHNDQKPGSAHLDAFTTFKDQLKYYINKARQLGGIPVLVTSTHRRKFDEAGRIINTLENYPEAVRQTAKETNTSLIDLNKMSEKFYESLGVEKSKKAFVHYPANTFPNQSKDLEDNTHFSTYGAYQLAKCVTKGIIESKLDLIKYLKKNIQNYNPSCPDPVEDFIWPQSPSVELVEPDGN